MSNIPGSIASRRRNRGTGVQRHGGVGPRCGFAATAQGRYNAIVPCEVSVTAGDTNVVT